MPVVEKGWLKNKTFMTGVISSKAIHALYLNTYILPPQTQEHNKGITFSRTRNEI